jgi:hypothetical protein
MTCWRISAKKQTSGDCPMPLVSAIISDASDNTPPAVLSRFSYAIGFHHDELEEPLTLSIFATSDIFTSLMISVAFANKPLEVQGGRKVMRRLLFSVSDKLSHVQAKYIESPYVTDLITL